MWSVLGISHGLLLSPTVPTLQSTVQTAALVEYTTESVTGVFPGTNVIAFIQPSFLGAPKASKANPGGAGNAEGV